MCGRERERKRDLNRGRKREEIGDKKHVKRKGADKKVTVTRYVKSCPETKQSGDLV